mgnify:CR=1 FL=1
MKGPYTFLAKVSRFEWIICLWKRANRSAQEMFSCGARHCREEVVEGHTEIMKMTPYETHSPNTDQYDRVGIAILRAFLPADNERGRHEKIPSVDGRSMIVGEARVVTAAPPSSADRATVLCLTTEL